MVVERSRTTPSVAASAAVVAVLATLAAPVAVAGLVSAAGGTTGPAGLRFSTWVLLGVAAIQAARAARADGRRHRVAILGSVVALAVFFAGFDLYHQCRLAGGCSVGVTETNVLDGVAPLWGATGGPALAPPPTVVGGFAASVALFYRDVRDAAAGTAS